MKLKIYYTSIKQRERKYFRQLIVYHSRLKRRTTKRCMLTNPFYPLSKPVKPVNLFYL